MIGWITVLALAAGAALVGVRRARFAREIAAEARSLWALREDAPPARLDPGALPAPVRRYLQVAGALEATPLAAARLRHGGSFRPALDGAWRPIRGVQYLAAEPPGFVWWGRVRLAAGLEISARDRSAGGEGGMRIALASALVVADLSGPELDAGALQRLVAELVWLPTALLDARHVAWLPRDASSARARLRVGGREVEVTFHFGGDGLPERITALRYRDVKGRGVLTPWTGRCADWREVGGVRVPFRLEASWELDGRDRPYARFEVERLEHGVRQPF